MSTSATDPADAALDDHPPLPPPTPSSISAPTPASAPALASASNAGERSDAMAELQPHVQPVVRARPGDLTTRWRFVLGAAWMAGFLAYAAVWQASVEIGIGTWWIGPRAQPTNVAVKVIPFVLCIAMAISVVYNAPRLLRLSTLGVGLAAIVALPDFSRSTGLAVTELLIAVLIGIVTAAAVTGRYRLAPTGASLTPTPASGSRDSGDSSDSPSPPRAEAP